MITGNEFNNFFLSVYNYFTLLQCILITLMFTPPGCSTNGVSGVSVVNNSYALFRNNTGIIQTRWQHVPCLCIFGTR